VRKHKSVLGKIHSLQFWCVQFNNPPETAVGHILKPIKYRLMSQFDLVRTMTTDMRKVQPTIVTKPQGFAILQIVLIPVIAALNYVTGVIINLLKLPLFMDTWATMFGTVVAGLWVGIAGGFLYNIVMAFTFWGLPAWVWGFINVYVALITWVFWKIGWISIKKPLQLVLAGILVGATNVIPTTLINVFVFGALPTYAGTAWIYAIILNQTSSTMSAVIGSAIVAEIPDKLLSLVLAAVVASRMPARFALRPQKST
jgi:energy-coupling factor transport system substrate-specific component